MTQVTEAGLLEYFFDGRARLGVARNPRKHRASGFLKSGLVKKKPCRDRAKFPGRLAGCNNLFAGATPL